MIQGTTLEAAFVDLQEACSNVSSALQIAGYVCLSRIKELRRICVLQPFSPLLFTRGPPAGPERLIRKLEKKITVEQCFEEWANDTTEDAEEKGAAGETSPMASKHLCTRCTKNKNQNITNEKHTNRRDFLNHLLVVTAKQ